MNMGKVAIYVARHGESEGNVAAQTSQTCGDSLDPFTTDGLTDVGKAQAELLGFHLKSIPFHTTFSSDYLRAVQTAQILLQQQLENCCPVEREIELKTDKRLRERVLGFEESVELFEGRIVSFFSELIQDYLCLNITDNDDDQNILIVSHAIAIQKLMCLLNSQSTELFGMHEWMENKRSCEKRLKNGSYHKIVLEIIHQQRDHNLTSEDNNHKTNSKVVGGFVEIVHCAQH